MRYTVECFSEVEIDDVSLMSGIYYFVKEDEQLLNYRSIFKKQNCTGEMNL